MSLPHMSDAERDAPSAENAQMCCEMADVC